MNEKTYILFDYEELDDFIDEMTDCTLHHNGEITIKEFGLSDKGSLFVKGDKVILKGDLISEGILKIKKIK